MCSPHLPTHAEILDIMLYCYSRLQERSSRLCRVSFKAGSSPVLAGRRLKLRDRRVCSVLHSWYEIFRAPLTERSRQNFPFEVPFAENTKQDSLI